MLFMCNQSGAAELGVPKFRSIRCGANSVVVVVRLRGVEVLNEVVPCPPFPNDVSTTFFVGHQLDDAFAPKFTILESRSGLRPASTAVMESMRSHAMARMVPVLVSAKS